MKSQEPFSASGDGRLFYFGTYVGVDRRTGQYIIHVCDGIQYARTVMRLPELNGWDNDRLAEIEATPRSLHVPKDPEVIFRDKKDADIPTADSESQRLCQVWSHQRLSQVRPRVVLWPRPYEQTQGFLLS